MTGALHNHIQSLQKTERLLSAELQRVQSAIASLQGQDAKQVRQRRKRRRGGGRVRAWGQGAKTGWHHSAATRAKMRASHRKRLAEARRHRRKLKLVDQPA